MRGKLESDRTISLRNKRKRNWRYALFALGGIALLVAGVAGYRSLQRSYLAKTTLLVADVGGAEPGNSPFTQAMIGNLRAALASYRDVRIATLGRAISEAEGSSVARAEGAKRQATLVVWGGRDAEQEALGRLHFELLRLPKGVPEPVLAQSLVVQVRFEKMTIPALFAAGMARYIVEDWDGALAAFGSILGLSSEQPTDWVLSWTYTFIADIHYAKGNLTEAIANYDQALTVRADSAEALVKRGIAYGTQGNYDRAIDDLNQAITLKHDLAEAYYHGGNAYYAKRELDMAIAYYDQAISKRSDYAEAYCNRGLAYASDGDYERALLDLDQAIQLKPGFVRAYSNRGSVHYARGDYDRAIADYNRVIALMPDFAEAYFNRGVTYMAQGKKGKAGEDLKKFLELSADPSWRQLAQQRLAELGVR